MSSGWTDRDDRNVDVLDAPERKPKDEKAKRAGKQRAARLADQRRGFPFGALALANCVAMRRRRWPKSVGATVMLLSEDVPAVEAVLKAAAAPHKRTKPATLVPFVIAGYYLAGLLSVVSRPPHAPDTRFMDLAYEADEILDERWCGVAHTLFASQRDRDAWTYNCGAAAAWIERLRNTPRRALALVRRCENPSCPKPFFVRRSARNPRFCRRPGCRQAAHRTSDE